MLKNILSAYELIYSQKINYDKLEISHATSTPKGTRCGGGRAT